MSDHKRNSDVHMPDTHDRNEAVHAINPAADRSKIGEESSTRNEAVHPVDC